MTAYRFKKAEIRSVIVRYAKIRKRVTYGALGAEVGIPATGPWKPILDSIAHEEIAIGRPDLTCLVVRKATCYPSQIDFEPARRPTPGQKAKADRLFEEVWKFYQQTQATR